jgi:hypothetical protein
MTATTDRRAIATPSSPPSVPRLHLESTGSRRTLLDGGWWPRSTDPVAELPGLILAIDARRGPIARLVLSAEGWTSHPRRIGVDGRVVRVGYFASQPATLLTALSGDGNRVDLLVVAPDTDTHVADATMLQAATIDNRIHAPELMTTSPLPLTESA